MNPRAQRDIDENIDSEGDGSIPGFDEIYERYGSNILRLAFRFTRNEEKARDLTQDIFMKVYESLDRFRGDAQIGTWIHRISVNHILNHLRKERRYAWYDIMDDSISSLLHSENSVGAMGMRASAPSPDQIVEQSERERIVWNAIESLRMKYRVPFVLFRFEEMSYKEIAKVLNVSLSAVESRIHRAKQQLVKKLRPIINQL